MSRTGSRNLVLAAMIFAVAMSFIDQTIVAIAATDIQRHLHLTTTGVQWTINSYLLALAVFFAFGGRLADIYGHAKICVIGVITFALASALCGLTPATSIAEPWLIFFRAVQGAGGALLFPAALAIVVQNFQLSERGRALAIFFGIAGGLTAVGPILGGYLVLWSWRSIFWINLPVAAIALLLIYISKPQTEHKRAPLDFMGLFLIAVGIGASILGLQESAVWGWSNPATWICIVGGLLVVALFVRFEITQEHPLINVRIFLIRAFSFDNAVLVAAMISFIPLFLFASEYAQISLGYSSSNAGFVILWFFLGFAIGSQVGGRRLDNVGVRRPVVVGTAIAAAGFFWWSTLTETLHMGTQTYAIILTGFGMGAVITAANTDAVNRAGRLSYGEATGITQTVRNYAASLGLAILGTILINDFRSRTAASLESQGVPASRATSIAKAASESSAGASGKIPHYVAVDFAQSFSRVLVIMGAVMVAGLIVSLIGLPRGKQETVPDAAPVAT
jgi:EmrB/QacA subfamily drug resistance transporter